jgi:hypothetical protein
MVILQSRQPFFRFISGQKYLLWYQNFINFSPRATIDHFIHGVGCDSPFCTWPHRPLLDLLHQSWMVTTEERGAVRGTEVLTENTCVSSARSLTNPTLPYPAWGVQSEEKLQLGGRGCTLTKKKVEYHCSRRLFGLLSGPGDESDMVLRNVVFLRSIRYKLESPYSPLSPSWKLQLQYLNITFPSTHRFPR